MWLLREVPSRSGVVSLVLRPPSSIRALTDTELWPDIPLSGVPPGLEGPGPDIRRW